MTRMRENMGTKPNNAAAESSKVAALETKVAALDMHLRAATAALEVAGQQLHYLATVAGVSSEFEALKREGAKKVADIMNPGQPIPDPPGGAPTQSTEEAEAPEAFDDPRNPGITPGSTGRVPAQQVDSPLAPGTTMPVNPYTQLVDVTQPVAGTETHVPYEQTKIETDVRVGDPMVNATSPEGYGFPLTGPFAADGASYAGTTTSPGFQDQGRTMASIRLAKLRKSAGLVPADQDELMVATSIERTAALSDEMINHEIRTLEATLKAQGSRTPKRRQGGPLPKQASQRRAPSLAGVSEMAVTAAGSSFDDGDASDLFLSESLTSD